ncbi:TetR/AcrR family transcriptional regulator [Actinokineospora pegani]|uniref:TetR/AcrR family transcriptional regulator n=1 Tax=Actinokineospora pegani TaxID=2654637 RepID=UPI0018D32A1A|nr:TetR/AcrR family transcriptional regulator [Actinokineospora pegani]
MSEIPVPGQSEVALPRPSRVERAAQTKQDVLAAAGRVFARRGYAAASVAEIAEEAGYTHGALYTHFSGKQELFLELFEQRVRDLATALSDEHAATPGAPVDRVRALTRLSEALLAEDSDRFLLHVEFAVLAARDPELRAGFLARVAHLPKTIRSLIEATSDAADDVDPGELALGLYGLAVGLGLFRWIAPGAVRPTLYGDLAMRLLTPRAD